MHAEIHCGREQPEHQRLNMHALRQSHCTSYANHHAGFYISNTRHTQRKIPECTGDDVTVWTDEVDVEQKQQRYR